jgi:chromosome partitioning protein
MTWPEFPLEIALPAGTKCHTLGASRPTMIAFINQKGGCGKSSCCFHLGGFLATEGYRVLLVDADPQASLSQGFFGSSLVESLVANHTTASAFADDSDGGSAAAVIRATDFDRLFVLPANHTLAPFNVPRPESTGMRQFALQQFLADLPGLDIVLIDCPPNLYQCSWNAMLAADYVVIPVPPEDFGAQGLRMIHQGIRHAQALNPRLQLLGHLVTRFDGRLVIHRAYERKLRQIHGDSVFRTVIPEASAFKVALTRRTPVTIAVPRSKAADLTRSLGREILQRIASASALRRVA